MAVSVPCADKPCFPGDVLSDVEAFEQVVLGPGVVQEDTHLVATKVGISRWDAARSLLWVFSPLPPYLKKKSRCAASP